MRWSVPVRDVMSSELVSVDVESSPSAIQALLEGNSFHHLPVLDGDTLVGVVSAIDVARVSLGKWVDSPETAGAWLDSQFRVRDLMTWEPEFVRAGDSVRVAADKLSSGAFHCLPVLSDDDQLIGIVTSTDLLRHMAG